MVNVGDVFLTTRGQIGKVVGEFDYGDGFKFITAIWDGAKWSQSRLNALGRASDNTHHYSGSTDKWRNFYNFTVVYDQVGNFWHGTASHHTLSNLYVSATRCSSPEEVMKILKNAAKEKMIESLRPLGYSIKTEDAA